MALDTRDKLIAACAGATMVPIYKSSIASQAAGYISSLWRATGNYLWGQGAIPGAAATCDDTLLGGIALPSVTTEKIYIVQFVPVGATINTWMLYDRLAHMGGLSGVTTGDQTVNVSIATAASGLRCLSSGADVVWFAEMYTAIGTTAQTVTVTYVNQSDATVTTTISIGGASPLNQASRCIQIVPVAGDSIKSVTKINFGTTTGTAGSWGITARRRLATVGQMVANIAPPGTDAVSICMPEVKATSCIEALCLCSTTSTGLLLGELEYAVVA